MGIPFISIIVPVYKVPKPYIKKNLLSLSAQTLRKIEIIVVDDGSPDDIGIFCDEIAKEDSRIKVIHKSNGGLASARNAGVKAASGKYIMFVDGDDWIERDCCEEAYKIAEKSGSQIVMFGMTKDFKNESIPYKYHIKDNYLYDQNECKELQKQVLNYNSNISTATAKLIKRDIFAMYDIWHNEELKQGAEGIVFTFQLFGKVKSAIFLNEVFYHYTYNEESISSSYSEETIRMVIDCFKYIKNDNIFNENFQLYDLLRTRILYAVISSVISGYFNPDNNYSYRTRKEKCNQYLNEDIVDDALRNSSQQGISKSRKIVLFLIRRRMFLGLYCMGCIRKWQKTHK